MLALGAFFAFSLMPVFTRAADAPVITIAAWRAVLVALVFGAWAFWKEGGSAALVPQGAARKLGVLYGLALALASSTFVAGYAFTTAANTIFLHNLAPAVAFPLAWWAFRERPSATALTGAAVAVLGVGLLSGVSLFQFSHMASTRFLLGDFLAFVSAIGYAAVLVCTRATRRADTPILGTLWVAWVVAATVLCVVALATDGLAISGVALAWVLGLAVVSTNVPFWLLNLSMREIGAGLAAVLSLSEVVFVTLLGVALYGENLAPIGWMGGVLVTVGVLYPLLVRDDVSGAASGARLPPETLGRRWSRLGLGLLLVNVGAALALIEGLGAGALLAWGGLACFARLGAGPLSDLLGGRFAGAVRWALGALAVVVLAGLGLRGGWDDPSGSLVAATLAGVAWLASGRLAAGEGEDRDARPLGRLGLAAFVVGQILAVGQHPAGVWLQLVAALAWGVEAWGVVLGAVRGAAPSALDRLGDHLSGRWAWGAVGVAWLLGGVVAVPPGHHAVVERFGAPLPEAADAGLLVRLPPPLERVRLVDTAGVRSSVLTSGDTPLLCGDQSMVAVSASVHWIVADPHAWLYGAAEPERTLTTAGRSALVDALARRTHDEVLTVGRAALGDELVARAQTAADHAGLGIRVQDVHLASASVPAQVTAAFLDVISADEERSRSVNLAEAYATDVLPRARGDALALLEQAQGDAIALAARAEASAERVVAIADGGAAAPELTRRRLRLEARVESVGSVVVAPVGVQIWLGGSPVTVEER